MQVKLGDFGLSKELPYAVDLGDGSRSVCTLAFTMCAARALDSRERVSVAAVRPPLLEDFRSDCFLGRCGTPEFLAPEFIFSRDYRCEN